MDEGALITLGIAAVTTIGIMARGRVVPLSWIEVMGGIAAAQFVLGAIRLPRWARLRRQQMEEIAGRLTRGL